MRRTGSILILASATAFGAMAIFAKLAYDEGANVATLLAARFVLAALLLWALLLATGAAARARALAPRDVALALGLGAVGYALQAGAYFSALERIDASVLALLLYTFPALVAAGAAVLGREHLDGRRLLALALASGGMAMIVAGAGTGALDPVGTVLGLAAAATYAAYILTSQGISGRVRADVLAAVVCTGAAASLTGGGTALGLLHPGEVSVEGWLWLGALAAVSTVAAIALFFAGLRRVGPTSAAILSTLEPLVTVLLAAAVFSERLTLVQLAGGALVLAAVPALHARLPGLRALRPADARR